MKHALDVADRTAQSACSTGARGVCFCNKTDSRLGKHGKQNSPDRKPGQVPLPQVCDDQKKAGSGALCGWCPHTAGQVPVVHRSARGRLIRSDTAGKVAVAEWNFVN